MNDTPKLEKGGLALIVGAVRAVGNIGREVTLDKFIQPGEKFWYRGGVATGAKGCGTWMVAAEGLEVYFKLPTGEIETIYSDVTFVQSNHLIPLKGKEPPIQKDIKRILFLEKVK